MGTTRRDRRRSRNRHLDSSPSLIDNLQGRTYLLLNARTPTKVDKGCQVVVAPSLKEETFKRLTLIRCILNLSGGQQLGNLRGNRSLRLQFQ
jgi:hypothetical protein